ncbi:MAG: GGDEF domain-containing protein [Actinomycetota bacterium]|nr:GGDEF domain-containing protein [Actinomycetota bacterium]
MLLRPESLPPGIALDESGEPHLDWVAAARYGGTMFIAAGVLGLLSLALPNAEDLVPLVAVTMALAAIALGAAGILLRRSLSPAGVYCLSGLAVGCITVFAVYGHREMTADSILPAIGFYLWLVLFAGYFFPLRAVPPAIVATGAAASYAVFAGGLDISLGTWFVMLSAFCLAGFVVAFLRQRVTRLLSTLARAARVDPLTGILNRGGFEERFVQELERARRNGESVALLVADIDRFKQINDRFGHAAGDDVLARVARVLTASTRPHDVVARLGGEEFGILLAQSDSERGVYVAERIRHDVTRMEGAVCGPVAVTVSVGVAAYPGDGVCRESLFRVADAAVYAAKDLGRDRVVACSPRPAAPLHA